MKGAGNQSQRYIIRKTCLNWQGSINMKPKTPRTANGNRTSSRTARATLTCQQPVKVKTPASTQCTICPACGTAEISTAMRGTSSPMEASHPWRALADGCVGAGVCGKKNAVDELRVGPFQKPDFCWAKTEQQQVATCLLPVPDREIVPTYPNQNGFDRLGVPRLKCRTNTGETNSKETNWSMPSSQIPQKAHLESTIYIYIYMYVYIYTSYIHMYICMMYICTLDTHMCIYIYIYSLAEWMAQIKFKLYIYH